MRTFWVMPMAPKRTVPTRPDRARAGEAGAVVPTPEGCHPAKNWSQVEDQLGKGTNWPTTGSRPPDDPPRPDDHHQRSDQPDRESGPAADPAPPVPGGDWGDRRDRRDGGGSDRPGSAGGGNGGRSPGGAGNGAGAGAYPCSRPSPDRSRPSPDRRPGPDGPDGPDGRQIVDRGQLVSVGAVEPVLEHPSAVGGEPGAASDLEQADLLVAESSVALQFLALAADHGEVAQIPPPGPDYRPGPGPVAGQLRHDDLAEGQHEDLRHHPEQMEAAVALEHGQELVTTLQFLEGHRWLGRLVLATHQGLFDRTRPRRPTPRGGAPGHRGRR